MRKSRIILPALVMLSLSLAFSCNHVKLDYEEVDAGQVGINLRVEWPEDAEERPDSMYLALGRLINTHHAVYDFESSEEVQITSMPNGEYYILTFNKENDLYKPVLLETFDTLTTAVMRQIAISVDTVKTSHIIADDIKDFNPNVLFVEDAGNFYASLQTQTLSPEHLTEVVLHPEKLSSDLRIQFSVLVDENIKINSMKVYMSGVVRHVHPMTKIVNYNDLYRVNMDVEEYDHRGNTIYYEAQAKVLGLFPSANKEFSAGAGILNVIVNASSDKGEKTYYAGINLINTITEAEIMSVPEDESGYILDKKEILLQVPSVMSILNDRVGTQGDDGVDEWFDQEYIDIEV